MKRSGRKIARRDHTVTTEESRQDANGKQLEKTLAEGMRYLLDSKIATDVCIEVGPPNGETVIFHAHKCVLMSRSEVFECMFSSGMTECSGSVSKVRVEDIDPDIFKELLNYIYYETASMCSESAAYLMYAAKKYMLHKVVRDCRRCLMESLDVNNAIHLLDQSLHLDEQKLQSECLRLISANATAVLIGTEIFSASRQVLEAILEADTLPVTELIIYETAVKWAKHQLQSEISGGEDPTDFQIREALGDLLYKIRFPVMKPTEFAEITAGNDLLTAEEKESVYYYLVTKKKYSQLKFPTERRIGKEVWIDSAVECTTGKWSPAPHLDAITFVTDKDILLTGIGLNLGYSVAGYDVDVEILEYDVDVESLQSVSSMFKQLVRIPRRIVLFSTPCKISLDKPIGITAGVIYSVKALSHVNNGGFAKSCRAVCAKDSVTFTFFKHSESQDNPEVEGQIPRMYFCKAI